MVKSVTWMKGLSRARAFTLIELLVVIAVIGILAGLLLGVLPGMQARSVRGRVKAEMAALVTAIHNYKAKSNFFPPGDNREGYPNTLYYELTGTTNAPVGGALAFTPKFSPSDAPLTAVQLKTAFGMDGFLNTAPAAEGTDVPNFYPNLRDGQVREMTTNGVTFKVLV